MPYIKQEDRKHYNGPIKTVVETIVGEFKLTRRAEMLGWFCRRVVLHYTFPNAPFDVDNAFNSLEFDGDRARVLKTHAQVLANTLRQRYTLHHDKYFDAAGDLNYVLSAILWGVMGDAPGAESAKYGFRSMVREMINHVREQIVGTVDIRLQMMVRGVLNDVIDEMYRRKTAVYEDQKIEENGDLWPFHKGR
jgi:hypothetical protein